MVRKILAMAVIATLVAPAAFSQTDHIASVGLHASAPHAAPMLIATSTPGTYLINVAEYNKAYEANAMRAASEVDGKILVFGGKLTSITRGLGGHANLSFDVPGTLMGITARMHHANDAAVMKLNKGQVVNVACTSIDDEISLIASGCNLATISN